MIEITNKMFTQLVTVFNAANELVSNEFAAATCVDNSPVGAEDEVCEQWNGILDALEENADDITTFLDNIGAQ